MWTDLFGPCPKCGSEDVLEFYHFKGSYLVCGDCGYRTKEYKVPEDAYDAWNRGEPNDTD